MYIGTVVCFIWTAEPESLLLCHTIPFVYLSVAVECHMISLCIDMSVLQTYWRMPTLQPCHRRKYAFSCQENMAATFSRGEGSFCYLFMSILIEDWTVLIGTSSRCCPPGGIWGLCNGSKFIGNNLQVMFCNDIVNGTTLTWMTSQKYKHWVAIFRLL